MHSIKIINIATEYLAVENGDVMIVTVEVFRDEESLGERKFTYPLNTPEKVLVADFKKMKATLDGDYKVGQESVALEKGLANANKLKQSLTGYSL